LGTQPPFFPEPGQAFEITASRFRLGVPGQARSMTSRESTDEDRELERESDRYRKAAVEALGQLEWCIEYLYEQRRAEIARTLARNRTTIIERARL
jgi:hypothetical protein